MLVDPPPLEEMLVPLQLMTGRDTIDPDLALHDLGIDSIDVLEWVFTIEDRLHVDTDEMMDEFIGLDSFGALTLRQLYGMIVDYMAEAHGQRG